MTPRNPPSLVEVGDAYLSEVATGELATIHRLNQWFRGAVYDHENTLVRTSQRVLGDRRGTRAAADPDRIERRDATRSLEGTWLYGGTWASVFGHFLMETLTTLWPALPEPPAGLVFHSNFGKFKISDWHLRFLELAGWGNLPIHVVGREEPVQVERLIIPGRAISLHAWVHPEALQVWGAIASGFRDAGGPERVYISRTYLNDARRREGHRRAVRTTAEHDRELDRVFAARGFQVIHPEALDVDTQLRAVASAGVIAGLSGSGLHHSAFMPPGGRVLELGDGRSSKHPVPMQVAIDTALGHERCFLAGTTSAVEVSGILEGLGL